MKTSEINEFIEAQGSKIFALNFIKRTDGSIRRMVCRKGVKFALKGGVKKFDDKEKNLVTVFDMSAEKMAYRSFGMEGIFMIAGSGTRHIIEDFDKSLVLPQYEDEFKTILAAEELLSQPVPAEIHVTMGKACDCCKAPATRVGLLYDHPKMPGSKICKNCNDTLEYGRLVMYSDLERTDEELQLTYDLTNGK